MSWLGRLLRGAPAAAAPPDADDCLRAGFDREVEGDFAAAESQYRRALELDPGRAGALYLLGRIAERDRRLDEAIALLQKAVELRPREAIYRLVLGNLLLDAKLFADALEVNRAGLELLQDCTALRNNLAAALIELNRREEARAELETLRELLPNVREVHFNLAGIYREYGRIDEAIAGYRRALELMPDHAPTWSNLLLEMNYSSSLDAAGIAAEHRRFGERFARRFAAPTPEAAWPRRLRIAYLSPDFRDHVVMRFIEPILACHDRSRFETFCYYTHPRKDAVTERLRGLAEHWADCEELREDELAERIRADRIDILVDLAGHTAGNSLLTLAMKPAPVQASYLGYPNTTGLGAVDFRITDARADPPGESDKLSVERLVRLPRSYFCYRPERGTPEVGALPAQAAGGITFGCFNNFAKLSGAFLDCAARVLAAVPRSRLLLKGRPLSIPSVADGVRARFARSGIDAARLDLRGWESSISSHLSIYGAVDIALDSFPYNGATTTCEALWMGVPVVTLAGDRHAGRAGWSLLDAVGLADCVAHSADEYVGICTRLSGDLERLAALRAGLRERMRGSPLMDESGFIRALESCYLELWEKRSRADELPQAEGSLERVTELWNRAFESGSPGASADALNRAIAATPQVAALHYMLGCVLQAQGKAQDAIAAFRQVLALDPAHARAHNNLGCVYETTGNAGAAADCYREAIRLEPGTAQAHYNLGNLWKQAGDAAQAMAHIGKALAIDPQHADWRCNLGDLQYDQLQLDEAVSSFRAALEIDPADVRAHAGLGGALLLAGAADAAQAAFARALELEPERPDIESWQLLASHYAEAGNARQMFQRHLEWARRHTRGLARWTDHRIEPRVRRRLNVGYVSPDFVRHPVASFIEPVLASHDRAKCNVFCYFTGTREDEVTRRLRGLGASWRDIGRLSDIDAADRIRADGVDVLVDLAGHTAGGRLLLFARKPSPVQVSWLGYPDTTGLGAVDFRLSDAIADPAGMSEPFHTETLVRLPRGFLCYAPPADCPPPVERARDGAVHFGCFNNLAKVTPRMVELWAVLLRSVAGSRIILKAYGLAAQSARRRLLAQFESHGIEPGRVELRAPEGSFNRHLAQYGEIDVALDVFPYNGTTTTCEALWMGVPVVTLAGQAHASRVGASILTTAGLAELVTETPEQYLECARRLAADVEKRQQLRASLRDRLRASPLLDRAGFTRDLEAAYAEMWDARLRTQP